MCAKSGSFQAAPDLRSVVSCAVNGDAIPERRSTKTEASDEERSPALRRVAIHEEDERHDHGHPASPGPLRWRARDGRARSWEGARDLCPRRGPGRGRGVDSGHRRGILHGFRLRLGLDVGDARRGSRVFPRNLALLADRTQALLELEKDSSQHPPRPVPLGPLDGPPPARGPGARSQPQKGASPPRSWRPVPRSRLFAKPTPSTAAAAGNHGARSGVLAAPFATPGSCPATVAAPDPRA